MPLLSDKHFSVDGTLIEAWASHKSFQPKDGSDDGDGWNFHGQRRKNDTHQSTSEPQAKLYRKAARRAMRSWRAATALLLTAPSRRPAASPSGVPLRRCSSRKPNEAPGTGFRRRRAAPDIRRQRFDPLPLRIVQPKQVPAHDPNPSKNESGSYCQRRKINEL
jgi:hypothetical protein